MRAPRRAVTAFVALTAVALIAATAAAAPGPPGPLALAMSPALINAETAGAGALPTISLINRGLVGFRLTVAPALAGQALEGGLTLLRGRRNDALARRMFRLDAPRIIGPGATVEVRPFFLDFGGRRSVSVAAVITAVPLKQQARGITYRLRLLGALLVHRPHAATRRPTISWVRVNRSGQRRLQLIARVRNDGLTPAFITAVRFRVLSPSGRVLSATQATPGFLLSRSVRNFRGEVFHRFPHGRLRAEAMVKSNDRETRRSAFFVVR
jgi:hypothetical protein